MLRDQRLSDPERFNELVHAERPMLIKQRHQVRAQRSSQRLEQLAGSNEIGARAARGDLRAKVVVMLEMVLHHASCGIVVSAVRAGASHHARLTTLPSSVVTKNSTIAMTTIRDPGPTSSGYASRTPATAAVTPNTIAPS